MKNNSYKPYNFDSKYEYKTYKNIGKECKIEYKAKKNVLYKLYLLIRNNFNRDEKRYKNLNSFSEWEEYVNQTRLGNDFNKKDFIRFLKRKARSNDVNRNTIGSIVTPIYAILMSGALSILLLPIQNKENSEIYDSVLFVWCSFSVILLLILIFLSKHNYTKSNQYFFYKDYIEIIKKQ